MAKQVQTNAAGNTKASTAGPVKTPAPTQRPPDFDKDFTFGRQSYGSNAYGGASSDTPGKRTRADMTVNNDDADPVLATLRQHGSAAMTSDPAGDSVNVGGMPASQLRTIGSKNVPVHPMMARDSNVSRQPSYPGPKASIPGALQDNATQPVRTPATQK